MNMTKVSLQNCNMTNELKSFESFLNMNTLMDKQTYILGHTETYLFFAYSGKVGTVCGLQELDHFIH